jgi:hypothetical protein
MDVRKAEHAGSWYSNSKSQLTAQLDEWLAQVPSDIPGIGNVPIAGARVVISPHAGYDSEFVPLVAFVDPKVGTLIPVRQQHGPTNVSISGMPNASSYCTLRIIIISLPPHYQYVPHTLRLSRERHYRWIWTPSVLSPP